MCRLNLVRGLGPVLQIAEGYTVELPDEVAFTIEERTNIEWPTTWFVPNLTGEGAFKSVYDVMNNWGANHGAISYGHIGGQLITLASMLRIPVNMHNVPEERIFRPKAWSLFGTESLEAADFRSDVPLMQLPVGLGCPLSPSPTGLAPHAGHHHRDPAPASPMRKAAREPNDGTRRARAF